jgi:acyl-CoA hydrolase
MPRTHGDSLVHYNTFDAVVHVDDPIHTAKQVPLTDVDTAIGRHCASLIPDGATLQLGIGGIPNAVLNALTGHKDLGVHTELMSDGVLPLMESGVINNRFKKVMPHRCVSSFLTGSKALWDFVHDNPSLCMLDVSNANNPAIVSKNPAVHAINSAIELDITGQVCADSIGTRVYSGIGGQHDFMRAAAISRGGKPIIAIPSCTSRGASKIVPVLQPGAGVVTTRGHVHYVVTEYGIAELHTKSLFERAVNLANIAHPKHRDELFAAIRERFGRQVFPAAVAGEQ